MEVWKEVVGFDKYHISNLGNVKSFARSKEGRLLKPGLASNGYYTVALGRNNTRTIHSLIAEAFIGPKPENQEVMHIDGNRQNSVLSNLKYGTRTENILDAMEQGTWFSEARKNHINNIKSWGFNHG